MGDEKVALPEHLFVDSNDNILVADYGNNLIQVFHQDGTYVKSIGIGQLSEPRGVSMDLGGRIFVVEIGSIHFF